MNYLDIAHCFIERASRTKSADGISSAFSQTLEQLGFRYFACGSHVDPLHPTRAVMMLNYPREFVEQFSGHAWHRIDPVFLRADRSSTPFSWDAPEFLHSLSSAQHAVLSEARRFGLTRGFTVPIHAPGYPGVARASCSVVPDSARLERGRYDVVRIIAAYVFEAAWRDLQTSQPLPEVAKLTPRECECLHLLSQGKDQWSISRLLKISEHTVHSHIENARGRLGAANSAHAIAIAIASGQIAFGDVTHNRSSAPEEERPALAQHDASNDVDTAPSPN